MTDTAPPSPLLATTIADKLKQLIYSGELAPGSRLNEAALATMMGTSRGPIREAIRTLAGKGLVTAIPHRGMFVRQMSMRDMLESYDLRALIFGFAARRATEYMTPERQEEMEKVLTAMEAAHATNESDRYYELNLQFHELILQYSNNRLAAKAYESYVNELHVFRRGFFNYSNKMQRSNKEHRQIVQAMLDGDSALAGSLAEEHVLSGKQRLLDMDDVDWK